MIKRIDEGPVSRERIAALFSMVANCDPRMSEILIGEVKIPDNTPDKHPFGLDIFGIDAKHPRSRRIINVLTAGDDNNESVRAMVTVACSIIQPPYNKGERKKSYLRIFRHGSHLYFEAACEFTAIFIVGIDLRQKHNCQGYVTTLTDFFRITMSQSWGMPIIQEPELVLLEDSIESPKAAA